MKHRKKWMVLAAVILAAAVFAGLYWWYTTTPEYRARQLVNELRAFYLGADPGRVRRWLIDLGLVKEKEPRDEEEIIKDLVAIGEPAVPVLIEALKDAYIGREELSYADTFSAEVLSRIGIQAVPALIRNLKDKDSETRYWTTKALGEIGPAAKDAIPSLRELLKDEDKDVRQAAAEALKQIEAKTMKQENRLPQPD